MEYCYYVMDFCLKYPPFLVQIHLVDLPLMVEPAFICLYCFKNVNKIKISHLVAVFVSACLSF